MHFGKDRIVFYWNGSVCGLLDDADWGEIMTCANALLKGNRFKFAAPSEEREKVLTTRIHSSSVLS